MSISVVRTLADVVERAGVSLAALLRAAAIELDGLDRADARVSRAAVYRLCEAAIDLTQNPALGLHWAESLGGHAFVPISLLIAHAPTLRHALEALSDFHRLIADQLGYQLIEKHDVVTLRRIPLAGESSRLERCVSEMFVTGMFNVIRSFHVPARRTQVNFDYPAPAHVAEYERVFEGSARFDQPVSGIVFERAFMNNPSPHRDLDVHDALRSIAQRRVFRLTQQTPYAERARDVLVEQHACAPVSMELVAQALGLSVRSLRRRLSAEGRTYKSVLNEAFAILAQHRLRTTQCTIQEIAFELGFADTSGFFRAFKRQVGMTPQQYRSQQLGGI